MHGLEVGRWIAYEEGYMYYNPYEEDSFSFKTKREAIREVSDLKLDSRSTPKVKRVAPGVYEYSPKDVDTGQFRESICIERLTDENIDGFKEFLCGQMQEEGY